MAIWKVKGGYRARFQIAGETCYAPGIFKYKPAAKKWIEEEKERLKIDLEKSSSPDLALYDLVQAHLADVELTKTFNTLDHKKRCLRRFCEFAGDVSITDTSPALFLEFINTIAREISVNASNVHRKNLRAFYRWCQDFHGVMRDPTAPTRKKPHQPKANRIIPIQDIFRVMMAASGSERILVGTCWHTAARRGEVLRLNWADDIHFGETLEDGRVRLGTRKTKDGSMSYEWVAMNADLREMLHGLWRNRDQASPFLFPHYYEPDELKNNWRGEQRAVRILRRLCDQAEVERFGYHDIRRSASRYLNDLGKVGLKKVQQILRHRKQTTTERYVEGNYTDTREAMSLLELKNVETIFETIQKKV